MSWKTKNKRKHSRLNRVDRELFLERCLNCGSWIKCKVYPKGD